MDTLDKMMAVAIGSVIFLAIMGAFLLFIAAIDSMYDLLNKRRLHKWLRSCDTPEAELLVLQLESLLSLLRRAPFTSSTTSSKTEQPTVGWSVPPPPER